MTVFEAPPRKALNGPPVLGSGVNKRPPMNAWPGPPSRLAGGLHVKATADVAPQLKSTLIDMARAKLKLLAWGAKPPAAKGEA